jgi:pimeloyl-ACP methyl ester carboxylesterase
MLVYVIRKKRYTTVRRGASVAEQTNIPMSYSEHGQGDPIVLLHAFPLNGGMWEPQASALKDEYRVVIPDYPGFGKSSYSPVRPDIDYFAENVRKLLDELELDRVVLGGLSMGGYVAFACLRLFPERISALILANTRPDPDSEEARENRDNMARRVSEDGIEVLVEMQMERLLSPNTLENNQEVVDKVETLMLESSPDGVVAALGAMRDRPNSKPLLPKIEVPTLVVGGEEDAISSPEVMGEMAASIPGSIHHTISGAGHLSNMEAPEEFNDVLRNFLTKL